MKLDTAFSDSGKTIPVIFSEMGKSLPSAFGNVQTIHNGQNGATFTPSVSEDGVISWENDRGLENPPPVNIMGPAGADGQPGADGVSPVVSVTDIAGGHRVTIADKDGTKTFDVMDGADGSDGFSPIVSVSSISGGHRVTITDKNGAKQFDVMDGKDGTGGGGGSVVQADWAENDPEAPGYVANRTHYDIPKKYLLTWDGNAEGREIIDLSVLGMSGYLVKVSDTFYTPEELVGVSIRDNVGGTVWEITPTDFYDIIPGAVFMASEFVGVVLNADVVCSALGAPSGYITNGTFFWYAPGMGYVSALVEKASVKKLDDKYLSENVMRHGDGGVLILPAVIELPTSGIPYIDRNYIGELGDEGAEYIKKIKLWKKGHILIKNVDSAKQELSVPFELCVDGVRACGSAVVTEQTWYDDDIRAVSRKLVTVVIDFDTENITVYAEPIPDMQTITQNVIASLPIYNGEVIEQ